MPANGRRRHFKLELAEMEDRHHLTFDTYEEGKLTLEEYLDRVGLLPGATVHPGSVSALHVRAIETLPRDDRTGRSAQGPVRAEDRRGQQRSARTECVSDSNVQAGRVCGFLYFLLLRPPSQARRGHLSACAGHRPGASPSRSSISKTPRCSSRSRKGWGFEAFFTRITGPPARNWLRSDCRMTKESSMKPANPTHPDDQWRLVEHQVRAVRGR